MSETFRIGAYGMYPYISEDLFKQVKYASIKTKAGKIAYLLTLGDKAPQPKIMEGIEEARGALKWVKNVFSDPQFPPQEPKPQP